MYRLGKRAPRHDCRTLRLEKYLDLSALPPVPPARAWDKGIANWGQMMNDRLGDCTCAAAGHAVQVWTANVGKELTVPDSAVLAAYEAAGGYVPGHPGTDNGAVMLDVLNLWRKAGIGGHRIDAFADVQPFHQAMVKAAVDLFGGIYVGLNLPASAQDQVGSLWWTVSGGAAAPGSWGGHCVQIVDYDFTNPQPANQTLTCITWGALQKMTWRFFARYCDEAYVVLSPDWATGTQNAPSGFNLAALEADLRLVTA